MAAPQGYELGGGAVPIPAEASTLHPGRGATAKAGRENGDIPAGRSVGNGRMSQPFECRSGHQHRSFGDRFDCDKDFEKIVSAVKLKLQEFYSPDEAEKWMVAPHALLRGDTPEQVIAASGTREVLALIAQLQDGAFV